MFCLFVLFCFVLFCFVLFCFVLFCFILFYFILFYFILFHSISFHFILFYFISFHSISFHSILFISFHFISFHFHISTPPPPLSPTRHNLTNYIKGEVEGEKEKVWLEVPKSNFLEKLSVALNEALLSSSLVPGEEGK